KKDRYLYFVTFANDRSILETYSHVKGTDLSEREIARFLKANAAGGTWRADNIGTARRFKRSDGHAEATYAPVNGRPTLTVRALHSAHRGDQSLASARGSALSQHKAGNNSDHKEADNFSESIAGCVNTREVPVRNVRCDRGQDPSYNDEADSSGKAANFRLSQKEHC